MKRSQVAIFAITAVTLLVVITAGVLAVMDKQSKSSNQSTESQSEPKSESTYTKSEVATHNTSDDCWAIINQSVYDLTSYVNRHPGGEDVLLACGENATTFFESRQTKEGKEIGSGTSHGSTARSILETLKIGAVKED